MTHAQIDDDFYDHPRFARVSIGAWGVWVASVAYCRHHRTDGIFPASVSFMFRDGADLAARELVSVGLWLSHGEGELRVYNYEKKNQTKAQIEASITGAKERKERWKNEKGTRSEKVPALSLSPSLSLKSSSSPEGSAEGGTEPTPVEVAPDTSPEQRYAEAYAEGQRLAVPNAVFRAPDEPWQRAAINIFTVTEGWGKGLRGPALIDAIRQVSRDYRRSCNSDTYHVKQGFPPKLCLKWAEGAEWRPRRPQKLTTRPVVELSEPEPVAMTPEEQRAVMDNVRAIGRRVP